MFRRIGPLEKVGASLGAHDRCVTAARLTRRRVRVRALAVSLMVFPFTFVRIVVRIRVRAVTFANVLVPVAVVLRAVRIEERALAVPLVLLIFACNAMRCERVRQGYARGSLPM